MKNRPPRWTVTRTPGCGVRQQITMTAKLRMRWDCSMDRPFSQVGTVGVKRKAVVERPLPSPAVEGTHLSPQAHQRLQEELGWRSGEHRQDISQWIERAREHGDIRENADYDAAKNEQGHNEARVRQLEAMLRKAVVVEEAVGDVVAPGTIVEIKMEGDDDTTSYLVGSIEERHE